MDTERGGQLTNVIDTKIKAGAGNLKVGKLSSTLSGDSLFIPILIPERSNANETGERIVQIGHYKKDG